MRPFRKLRIALLATGIWGLTACATATAPKAPITPEQLLQVLVQIATQEDLADEKRIGSLLGLDIVMIPEPPFEMKDGRMGKGATANLPTNPGYLSSYSGFTRFYYRHFVHPERKAGLSLVFDYEKFCINYKDAIAQFKKHGELIQTAPPISSPLSHGAKPAHANPRSQSIHGYLFKGTRSSVYVRFDYTECITAFDAAQPVTFR